MVGQGPPPGLVRALVDGPSVISGLEWHEETTSTNEVALAAAARGVDEVYLVVADHQTAGRGRHGRRWQAPPGTALLLSLVCRPHVQAEALTLLPLLTGLAVAEATEPYAGHQTRLKWPNDVLIGERKVCGILVESQPPDVAVVGVGINIDWRGVERTAELAGATSLAEEVGLSVDRWRVLAAVAGLFASRYTDWLADPLSFLDAYRARSATFGRPVRVHRPDGSVLEGVPRDVDETGALLVADEVRESRVTAGDVEHLRPQ